VQLPAADAVNVAEQVPAVCVTVTDAGVTVTFADVLPPQLVMVMVALLFTVNVAVVVPWPPVSTAPGVALQTYPPAGTTPVTVAVIVPPLQMLPPGVSVIAGGGGTFVIGSVINPVQPFTVCEACNVQGPAPVKITDADELFAPYGAIVPVPVINIQV
jgi:hypothetical protein